MPLYQVPDRARADACERVDLCQQYRPIGIGAVAAAFSITRIAERSGSENARPAEMNANHYADSLAA